MHELELIGTTPDIGAGPADGERTPGVARRTGRRWPTDITTVPRRGHRTRSQPLVVTDTLSNTAVLVCAPSCEVTNNPTCILLPKATVAEPTWLHVCPSADVKLVTVSPARVNFNHVPRSSPSPARRYPR